MQNPFENIFTSRELLILSSIVQVGDSIYQELMTTQGALLNDCMFADLQGRIQTKCIYRQCKLESEDPKFPFVFSQRKFQYKQVVPELRNEKVILHIARSTSPDVLPYRSRYKVNLSYNNNLFSRQVVINFDKNPRYIDAPLYAVLVFGGRNQVFSAIQFPEPGYNKIAESFSLPQISLTDDSETKTFERKKAVLKKEVLTHDLKEIIL